MNELSGNYDIPQNNDDKKNGLSISDPLIHESLQNSIFQFENNQLDDYDINPINIFDDYDLF